MDMKIRRFPRLANDHQVSDRILLGALEGINKYYKKKKKKIKVKTLDESVFSKPRKFISSGILPIDCIVGYGRGFPPGICEIFGSEHTGKTALMECTLAESQVRGYYTGLFPMEFSPKFKRMKRVGINPERLAVFEDAETVEDIYDQLKEFVKHIRKEDQKTPIVIGVDTLAATPTRSEMDNKKGLEASDMGKAALQLSKFFRRMVRFLFINNVFLICVNQTRTNLGVMYGSKETTYGGKALRFYAWVRCRIKTLKTIKNSDDEEIGMLCLIKCIKNKFAPPFRQCIFPIYWTRGIDPIGAVWEYCLDKEIFRRKGTVYKFKGKKITKRMFPEVYKKNKAEIDKRLMETVTEQED